MNLLSTLKFQISFKADRGVDLGGGGGSRLKNP